MSRWAWEPRYRRTDGARVLVGYVREGARVTCDESGWWWEGRRFGSSTEAMEAADYARGVGRGR